MMSSVVSPLFGMMGSEETAAAISELERQRAEVEAAVESELRAAVLSRFRQSGPTLEELESNKRNRTELAQLRAELRRTFVQTIEEQLELLRELSGMGSTPDGTATELMTSR